jgi:hypothetical protein
MTEITDRFYTEANAPSGPSLKLLKLHRRVFLSFVVWLIANTVALGGGSAKPVWLVSNGFHTSLAFRARDLPFARQITGDRQADILLIGWGARDFYEGKVDPWTLTKAIFGIGGSILHVVPVRGPIWKRF